MADQLPHQVDIGAILENHRNLGQRIQDVRSKLPSGVIPTMGPISTGLGEIFMWTVNAEKNARKSDGTPYTPTDLREIEDWIIKPRMRMVKGITEVNSIGGYVKQLGRPDMAISIGKVMRCSASSGE